MRKKRAKAYRYRRYTVAPLSGAFMLTSMLGFLLTTVYTISGRVDLTWGFTFDLIFVIMFIASVVSITPGLPPELEKKKA